ncbi:MAG: hypothetical protein KGV44_03230 [Flavobacteriaceae bacterium]|nr:hypothetical protein [Flavobacteriaceae bacterium]
MNFYLLPSLLSVLFVIIAGIIFYIQFNKTFNEWFYGKLSKDIKEVEKRRFITFLALFTCLCIFNRELYKSFSWLLLIISLLFSIGVIFIMYKLNITLFNKLLNDSSNVSTKNDTQLLAPNRFRIRKKTIEEKINEPIFNLLRRYNYLKIDSIPYSEFIEEFIKGEKQVLKFTNAHEAKEFYNLVLHTKELSTDDYCKSFGYSKRTLKEKPSPNRFLDNFILFKKDIENLLLRK